MQTPTKGEPLIERLKHAFGDRHIRDALANMMSADPLEWLNDDGRDELVSRLVAEHKSARRYAAHSRKYYRERRTS
jgi:hypothetical protein